MSSSLEIIHCDPLSVSKRKYVSRIPNGQWIAVRDDVTSLHHNGWKHKAILAYLKSNRGLNVTLGQLGSKMSEWKLFTYRTTTRCTILSVPTDPLFRDHPDTPDHTDLSTQLTPKNSTIPIQVPHFQCSLPLYSSDDSGNLIPNWSAFLLRAAKGDSLAMKTICILAKSQRFKRHTQSDYQLYQKVIEAVRTEMSSTESLSPQVSVMVFHAILALAIQAGFMNGHTTSVIPMSTTTTTVIPTTTNKHPPSTSTSNEPILHLNAAGHMLTRINMQSQQQGCRETTLKQLIDFFNVASYLIALSRCSRTEVATWPLLMYHLIVQ